MYVRPKKESVNSRNRKDSIYSRNIIDLARFIEVASLQTDPISNELAYE